MSHDPVNYHPVEDDTQPNMGNAVYPFEQGGLQAPPRILFYGAFAIVFVVTVLAGVIVYRNFLIEPQRVYIESFVPVLNVINPDRIDNPDATAPASLREVSTQEIGNLFSLEIQPTPGRTDVTLEATEASVSSPASNTEQSTPSVPFNALPTLPSGAVDEAMVQALILTPLETQTSQPTETPLPSATPLPTALPSPVPQVASTSSSTTTQARTWPTNHMNTGFTWYKQTWNNCGPTNITMALSFYGWTQDQSYAGTRLKPDREDKNVSPVELVGFVEDYTDLDAMYRYGGDLDTLRRLIAAGFPVIVERSHMFEGYEWLGHYQTLVGYDDLSRNFFIYDSFLGEDAGPSGITETYEEVDAGWEEFNRVFIVVYTPSREGEVMAILGQSRVTLEASAEHAFTVAQDDARNDPENGFLWFNMGTSLTRIGLYEEASRAFDRALTLGLPWRMLWYQFAPFEAYYQVGRYDDVLLYVENNLSNGGDDVEETYYWQGRALAAQGNVNGARQAFQRALNRNSNFTLAQEALDDL